MALDGDADRLLASAAAVEADSEHPLARAIVETAGERGPVPPATGFRAMTGRGVEATVDGVETAVGGPRLLRRAVDRGRRTSLAGRSAVAGRGASVLYVVAGARSPGHWPSRTRCVPSPAEAVDELRRLGVEVAMITGDARSVAQAVGTELGIDRVMAEVLPGDKHSVVAGLQESGRRVAMVGDGVNDAPALAQADVGIAIGAGTDVAIESAGVVLASDDPRGVVAVRRLSAAGYRKMMQNLVWAAGYNVAAIPLAAGAFAWAGLTLSPAVGAALMSISTVVVALNAQLLRRLELRPG